jgi:hypothetical protein
MKEGITVNDVERAAFSSVSWCGCEDFFQAIDPELRISYRKRTAFEQVLKTVCCFGCSAFCICSDGSGCPFRL